VSPTLLTQSSDPAVGIVLAERASAAARWESRSRGKVAIIGGAADPLLFFDQRYAELGSTRQQERLA
jgi:hypothetical protein